MATQQKSRTPAKTSSNFFEQLKDTTANELRAVGSGMVNSVLGRYPQQQTESAYQPNRLATPERMMPMPRPERKPRQEFMLFSWKEREDTMYVKEQIKVLLKQIKEEIVKIEQQNKSLVTEAARLTVEQLTENPGIYHVRFLEWILTTLRDLKQKVSESATWFSMLQGKRGKKGFWGKAQKHGSSFTLSGERTASTQSG